MESNERRIPLWLRVAAGVFVLINAIVLLILLVEATRPPGPEWRLVATGLLMLAVFVPPALGRTSHPLEYLLFALSGAAFLVDARDVLALLPGWYVAVVVLWIAICAFVLLPAGEVSGTGLLLLLAGFPLLLSAVLWPGIWPDEAGPGRRFALQFWMSAAPPSGFAAVRRLLRGTREWMRRPDEPMGPRQPPGSLAAGSEVAMLRQRLAAALQVKLRSNDVPN